MANGLTTEVFVRRRVKGGWYVYTCDALPGLYVAHQDDKIAYHDLPKAIRLLMKLDNGVSCTVSHKLTYAKFLECVHLSQRASDSVRRRTDDLMHAGDEYHAFIIRQTAGNHEAA